MTPTVRRVLGGVAILVVVAAAAVGLKLSGSPAAERARRLDVRRVDDLTEIARAMDRYYAREHTLPSKLADLGPPWGPPLSITDPATGAAYEYRVLAGKRYELCAVFTGPASDASRYEPEFWKHGAGRQCFPVDVREVQR